MAQTTYFDGDGVVTDSSTSTCSAAHDSYFVAIRYFGAGGVLRSEGLALLVMHY